MGLWVFEVYHPLDYQEWIYSPNHDKHEFDHSLVFDGGHFLVQGQDVQEVDEEFQGTSNVESSR
jgi:hypothetical protein